MPKFKIHVRQKSNKNSTTGSTHSRKRKDKERLREIPDVADMTHNALQHVSLWQRGSCFPLVGFPSIHKRVHCEHDKGKGRNHEQPGSGTSLTSAVQPGRWVPPSPALTKNTFEGPAASLCTFQEPLTSREQWSSRTIGNFCA